MKIKIWGVRGSIPSPLKPQDIEEKIYQAILGLPPIDTKDPEAVRAYMNSLPFLLRGTAGGNTSCVEVQAGEEIIIIDAGSGIRELSTELMKGPCGRGEGVVHLLFTHCHWDHIQGFPFFAPAFVPGNRIRIYSIHDLEMVLRDQQRFINWPVSLDYMQATFEFISLKPGEPFSIGDLAINTIENHHPGQAYAYRFEDGYSIFVHASDSEYEQLNEVSLRPYIDFFSNADVLIFDAQFTQKEVWEKVGWGHSSSLIGADLASRAGVKNLILFHHDPTYSDAQLQDILATTRAYQEQNPSRPSCEIIVAYEGLTLDLTPPGAVELHYDRDDNAAILTPTHIFDERGVDFLEQRVTHLRDMGWPSSLVIDLSRVKSFGMAGLKSLISLRQEHEETSIVLAGPSKQIRQMIDLAGFLDFFAIYPSVEKALSALQVSQTVNLPGQLLKHRYLIENKVGSGRRGSVFAATDTQLDLKVAVKVLSSSFSEQAIDHFLHQAQRLKRLNHRHIIDVFDYDRDNGLAYIVEEFAPGTTLRERLVNSANNPISLDEALDISVDIALALEYAHSRGVIHGNLTPKNIRLDDAVKLTNFGMGHLEEGRNLLEKPLLILTATYLAPEQILGQPLDARTDLYALGVILYELFTSRPPFTGDDQAVMEAHVDQMPRPPQELNPYLSPDLSRFILKLLEKNPNNRYADAKEVRRISKNLVVTIGRNGQAHRLPLVGHQKEIKQLQSAWQDTKSGKGQLVFITGEAGIGKTHLAQAAADQVGAAVCLIGSCKTNHEAQAYHPFIEALETYFTTVPPELFDEETYQYLSGFAHLIPQLDQMLWKPLNLLALDPAEAELHLMTSLTEFIKRAAQDRPWILILDDLQWADDNSLKLLYHLARHTPSMPLLLIGTYRDADLAENHPLQEILRDLRQFPAFHLLSLDRLSRAEVGQVLTNLWQQSVPEEITEEIYQRTEGNPFCVEVAARDWIEEGNVILEEHECQ